MVRFNTTPFALATALTLYSGTAFGSNFNSFEQSASSLGYAHADMGSLAEDATTNWYNPSGITRFNDTEIAVGATNVHYDTSLNLQIDFIDLNTSGSIAPLYVLLYGPLLGLIQQIESPTQSVFNVPKAKGDTNQVYGYLHIIQPLLNNYRCLDISVGLSITTPWNLSNDFSLTNVVSYDKKMQIGSFAIAPTVSIRAFKMISIGFQPRWERFSWYQSSELERLGGANFSYRDWFWAYNISGLIEFSPTLRVGGSYEFNTSHTLRGSSNIFLFGNFSSKAKINLPNILNLGGTWEIDPCIAMTATFVFSNWSRFKTVKYLIKQPDGSQVLISSIPYNLKDSYFIGLGGRYLVNDSLTLRAGISYETPATRNRYREMKLHDASKYGIGVGFNYAFDCHLSLDFGYLFSYSPRNSITNNPVIDFNPSLLSPSAGNVNPYGAIYSGSAKTLISTFGLQLNGRF